jgi:hypothetical protein
MSNIQAKTWHYTLQQALNKIWDGDLVLDSRASRRGLCRLEPFFDLAQAFQKRKFVQHCAGPVTLELLR